MGYRQHDIYHAQHVIIAHAATAQMRSSLRAVHVGIVRHVGVFVVAIAARYTLMVRRFALLAAVERALQNPLPDFLPIGWISRPVIRFDWHELSLKIHISACSMHHATSQRLPRHVRQWPRLPVAWPRGGRPVRAFHRQICRREAMRLVDEAIAE